MVLIEHVTEKDLEKLKNYGYEKREPKSSKEIVRYRKNATLILYKNGNLQIQGRKNRITEAEELIRKILDKPTKKISGEVIGSDESLKGDTFGGIVVAGFKADDEIREQLKEIGVKDSKRLLNPDITRIAQVLIEKFPSNYHVESVFPKEFNKLNLRYNMTEILDLLHEKCYKKLAKNSKITHVVDLYPNCSVGDIREKEAESKYLEVAAASILARYYALLQIRELEKKAGFFIPLGSSNVENGLLEIKKKTLNFEDFVKLKFSNVVEFLNSFEKKYTSKKGKAL
ncbi:MAG: hypothetical protein QXE31_02545 [Candidatus Woesearchaeota archaeon]